MDLFFLQRVTQLKRRSKKCYLYVSIYEVLKILTRILFFRCWHTIWWAFFIRTNIEAMIRVKVRMLTICCKLSNAVFTLQMLTSASLKMWISVLIPFRWKHWRPVFCISWKENPYVSVWTESNGSNGCASIIQLSLGPLYSCSGLYWQN